MRAPSRSHGITMPDEATHMGNRILVYLEVRETGELLEYMVLQGIAPEALARRVKQQFASWVKWYTPSSAIEFGTKEL